MSTGFDQSLRIFRVTGNSITVEDTVRLNQVQPPSSMSEANPSATDESRVLSFAELKSLIEQGKTDQIPNNKHIPDAINVSHIYSFSALQFELPGYQDAPPSESTAQSRKKPWETVAVGE